MVDSTAKPAASVRPTRKRRSKRPRAGSTVDPGESLSSESWPCALAASASPMACTRSALMASTTAMAAAMGALHASVFAALAPVHALLSGSATASAQPAHKSTNNHGLGAILRNDGPFLAACSLPPLPPALLSLSHTRSALYGFAIK